MSNILEQCSLCTLILGCVRREASNKQAYTQESSMVDHLDNSLPGGHLDKTDTQPEDDVPSLDVAFDLTREQCAAQLTHLNGLDTKAGFVLASASLLTGALATWHVPTTTVHYPIFIEWFMMRIPLISIVIYLVVIGTSYFALIPRGFTISINPTYLWQKYSKKPERWTKRKVRATMAEIYQKNKQVIDRKIHWTMAAFFALALEAVLVAVILFFQTGG